MRPWADQHLRYQSARSENSAPLGIQRVSDSGAFTYQQFSPDSQPPVDTGAGNRGTVPVEGVDDDGFADQTSQASRKVAVRPDWIEDVYEFTLSHPSGYSAEVHDDVDEFYWKIIDRQGVIVDDGVVFKADDYSDDSLNEAKTLAEAGLEAIAPGPGVTYSTASRKTAQVEWIAVPGGGAAATVPNTHLGEVIIMVSTGKGSRVGTFTWKVCDGDTMATYAKGSSGSLEGAQEAAAQSIGLTAARRTANQDTYDGAYHWALDNAPYYAPEFAMWCVDNDRDDFDSAYEDYAVGPGNTFTPGPEADPSDPWSRSASFEPIDIYNEATDRVGRGELTFAVYIDMAKRIRSETEEDSDLQWRCLDALEAVTRVPVMARRTGSRRTASFDWQEKPGRGVIVRTVDSTLGPVRGTVYDDERGGYDWQIIKEDGSMQTVAKGKIGDIESGKAKVEKYLSMSRSSRRKTGSMWDSIEPNHKVAGWDWNEELAGYISEGASNHFACVCGSNIEAPGYATCHCGRIWNAYTLTAQGATRVVCREVPNRGAEVVLASKKKLSGISEVFQLGDRVIAKDDVGLGFETKPGVVLSYWPTNDGDSIVNVSWSMGGEKEMLGSELTLA